MSNDAINWYGNTTMVRDLKAIFRDYVGAPPWLVLILVGCVAHVASNVVMRKPITSAWGLIAPLTLGLALESYEIWEQYRQVGLFAPTNDSLLLILVRHAQDIALLLTAPVLIVLGGAVLVRLS